MISAVEEAIRQALNVRALVMEQIASEALYKTEPRYRFRLQWIQQGPRHIPDSAYKGNVYEITVPDIDAPACFVHDIVFPTGVHTMTPKSVTVDADHLRLVLNRVEPTLTLKDCYEPISEAVDSLFFALETPSHEENPA